MTKIDAERVCDILYSECCGVHPTYQQEIILLNNKIVEHFDLNELSKMDSDVMARVYHEESRRANDEPYISSLGLLF